MKALEDIKVTLWKLIFGTWFRLRYICAKQKRAELRIMNSEQTLDYIIQHRCSVCRFGDGEFQMIKHLHRLQGDPSLWKIDTFQQFDKKLAERLDQVLNSDKESCMVCIPYGFCSSKVHRGYDRIFLEREYLEFGGIIDHLRVHPRVSRIGDSYFTRFYLNRVDILDYSKYIAKLKQLWNHQNIVIVEGIYSRLGVGNDLFDNALSIRRILAPATNAYSCYDTILTIVKQHADNALILIALGQTATVLAYDLAMAGFQALDIGHADVEYEWMRMGATQKVAIPNKYVNEVQAGRINSSLDDLEYNRQIIAKISI